jgi:multidrug efflux pump subunit AcrA (membrane-fusion protein)
MNKKKLIYTGIIVLIIFVIYFFFSSNESKNISLTTTVKKEDFKSEILISGELQSTNSIKILAPSGLGSHRIYQIKIQHLIPEGTLVKKGDFVAKLDPSSLKEKILDAETDLKTKQSSFVQQQIDTTLSLKKERNSIKDLFFGLEEKELEMKESAYESPSKIRQIEISLQKIKRNLKQRKEDYTIVKKKEVQKMIRVDNQFTRAKNKLKQLKTLEDKLTIISENDGMITYHKSYNGTIKTGSQINTYNPTIAILPDLSEMESMTFSNEVDVRKVKKGMSVEISFDAFPEMKIKGTVTSVANIGEKKPGSDIKLFKVLIKLNKTNKNIRPGMTTSNKILSMEKKNVLTVPLEAIFSKDTIAYVYKKTGTSTTKNEVKLGTSNNEIVIINAGLDEGDVVYLNKPENIENVAIIPLNQ